MLRLTFTLLNLLSSPDVAYKQAAVQAVTLEAKYGIEAELLLSIAKVESNFNVRAVGRTHGEIGLMQLRPKYFPEAKFDVKNNMEIAAKHLAQIKPKCKKRYAKAWYVCYNVGVNAKIKYPELHPYYKKVQAAYAKEKYVKKTAASIRDRVLVIPSYGTFSIAELPK